MRNDEKRRWRQIGFQFAWGAIAAIGGFILFALAINLGMDAFSIGKDDCDRSAWHRCGMRVLTDAKTGQQYLVTTGGGIIARASH